MYYIGGYQCFNDIGSFKRSYPLKDLYNSGNQYFSKWVFHDITNLCVRKDSFKTQDFPGSPGVKTPCFHCTGHRFEQLCSFKKQWRQVEKVASWVHHTKTITRLLFLEATIALQFNSASCEMDVFSHRIKCLCKSQDLIDSIIITLHWEH